MKGQFLFCKYEDLPWNAKSQQGKKMWAGPLCGARCPSCPQVTAPLSSLANALNGGALQKLSKVPNLALACYSSQRFRLRGWEHRWPSVLVKKVCVRPVLCSSLCCSPCCVAARRFSSKHRAYLCLTKVWAPSSAVSFQIKGSNTKWRSNLLFQKLKILTRENFRECKFYLEEAKVKTQFSYSEKEIKSKRCLTVRPFGEEDMREIRSWGRIVGSLIKVGEVRGSEELGKTKTWGESTINDRCLGSVRKLGLGAARWEHNPTHYSHQHVFLPALLYTLHM